MSIRWVLRQITPRAHAGKEAQRAEERLPQIEGLPPKPPQYLPWLVALFPESDKVKPLLRASQKAKDEEAARLAAQPQMSAEVQAAAYNPNRSDSVTR